MQSRFQRAFEASSAVVVVAWAATAADALALLDETTPDVLLVDLGLPDASGITVIRRAKTLHPCCEIMVVSVFGDQRNVLASIEAGASGYLLKDDTADDFVERIIELRDGGSPITPIIARQLLVRLQPPHRVRKTRRPPCPTANAKCSICWPRVLRTRKLPNCWVFRPTRSALTCGVFTRSCRSPRGAKPFLKRSACTCCRIERQRGSGVANVAGGRTAGQRGRRLAGQC